MAEFKSNSTSVRFDAIQLFEATPGMNILFLPDVPHYTIAAVSHQMLQYLNLNKDDIVGKSPFDAFPASPNDPDFTGHKNLKASLDSVLLNKKSSEIKVQRYDVALGNGDFKEIYWQVSSHPILDDKGRLAYIYHTSKDITEQVRQEKMAQAVSRNFDIFLNHFMAPSAIVKGAEFTFSFVNDAFEKLIGHGPLVGNTLTDALPELQGQPFVFMLKEAFTSGLPFQANEMPVSAIFKDDVLSNIYLNISFTPYTNDNGQIEGIIILCHDVTEQVAFKHRQKETDLNSNVYELFMQSPIAFCYFEGPQYIIKLANQKTLEVWGKTNEVIGKPVFEVFPELQSQGFDAILYSVVHKGETFVANEQEVRFMRNGTQETLYLNFSYNPVRNVNGVIEGFFSTGFDVTELVTAKIQLAESESRFRNIIEQAPDPILILKGENMALEVANQPLLDLWHINTSAFGKGFLEILPEMENQGFLEMLQDVYFNNKTLYGYETPAVFERNGIKETVYFDFVYHPYKELDGSVSGVIVLCTNVTERVVAKLEQQKSENSFRLLANSMPQLVWTSDSNGALNYFNQAVFDYSGLNFGDIQKDGWIQIVHPDEKEENIKQWMHAVQTGEDFIFHSRFKKYDGEYRWQLSRAVPLKDDKGNIQLWVGTSTDINDQKLFEEDLQKRVAERTSELHKKNEELEQFAHVSSHDLQEPLRKIRIFSEMIKQKDYDQLSDFSKSRFDKISDAAARMSTSLKDLLNFTSLNRAEQFVNIDLNEVMNDVQNDLELVISQKNATIQITALPVINAIPLQMHQLFYNLLNNALKFSGTNTAPLIEISCRQVSGYEECKIFHLSPEKLYYKITIKDNGIGFEQSQADKIFTMFQRLHNKQQYSGTGIGLAICKKVVLNHEGCIIATSEPGQGATFNVLLPIL